jgi:alkylhydroperoxidase/carboxymuconolactone decarboxylase family protein YurZ
LMVAQSGQRLAMGEQIRETVNMMAVLDSNSCVSSHTTVIKQVVQEKRVC